MAVKALVSFCSVPRKVPVSLRKRCLLLVSFSIPLLTLLCGSCSTQPAKVLSSLLGGEYAAAETLGNTLLSALVALPGPGHETSAPAQQSIFGGGRSPRGRGPTAEGVLTPFPLTFVGHSGTITVWSTREQVTCLSPPSWEPMAHPSLSF